MIASTNGRPKTGRSQGKAASRAQLVSAALEREMRRQAAEADAVILRQQGAADDLDPLVEWTVGHLDIAG